MFVRSAGSVAVFKSAVSSLTSSPDGRPMTVVGFWSLPYCSVAISPLGSVHVCFTLMPTLGKNRRHMHQWLHQIITAHFNHSFSMLRYV